MSEAVQQGAGQSLRAEDLGPLVEGQVGGDQERPSLVALAEDLEASAAWGLRTARRLAGCPLRADWAFP